MAEVELADSSGRIWTANEFARERGYYYDEIEFAKLMQEGFGIHSYERMQEVWRLRDFSKKKNVSGSFPEGYDIGKALE